jgi:YVTN family beta-propeller protein
VTVFDARRRQLLATIEVGAVPVGILMTPDGKRAFVANTNANQVTVIDVPARKVLRTFTTGTEPDGMAWVPRRLIR